MSAFSKLHLALFRSAPIPTEVVLEWLPAAAHLVAVNSSVASEVAVWDRLVELGTRSPAENRSYERVVSDVLCFTPPERYGRVPELVRFVEERDQHRLAALTCARQGTPVEVWAHVAEAVARHPVPPGVAHHIVSSPLVPPSVRRVLVVHAPVTDRVECALASDADNDTPSWCAQGPPAEDLGDFAHWALLADRQPGVAGRTAQKLVAARTSHDPLRNFCLAADLVALGVWDTAPDLVEVVAHRVGEAQAVGAAPPARRGRLDAAGLVVTAAASDKSVPASLRGVLGQWCAADQDVRSARRAPRYVTLRDELRSSPALQQPHRAEVELDEDVQVAVDAWGTSVPHWRLGLQLAGVGVPIGDVVALVNAASL